MIIAIDGPSAAGKGTIARALARRLGYAHLDTGALYRAVAWRLRRDNASNPTAEEAESAAKRITPEMLTRPELREEATGRLASRIAAIPGVRAALLDFQRAFAATPPGNARGAVIDGRDVGSVVSPDADVKLFVTAAEHERALRRQKELQARGADAGFETVLANLRARDAADASRDISPLVRTEDAHLLDTTNLDIEAAVEAALDIVRAQEEKARHL